MKKILLPILLAMAMGMSACTVKNPEPWNNVRKFFGVDDANLTYWGQALTPINDESERQIKHHY